MNLYIMRPCESIASDWRGRRDNEAAAWAFGTSERDVNGQDHTPIIPKRAQQ